MLEIKRKPELTFYVDHVSAYEREAKTWESRGKKIVKRYRDNRGDTDRKAARFNILWSNVQTLHPALYNGTPTPNVDRRYEDDEEVNTTVAQILERAASYYVKTNDFDDCMGQAVLDRLLPGRGTMWIRYVPNFKDVQIAGDAADGAQITDDVNPEDTEQELYSEDVVADYVHWCDYGHNVARTWQENRMVWRKVYLGRKELVKRFGKIGEEVPLDAKALGKKDDDQSEANTKGTVYELWDRVTKMVYWFHKDMEDFLDQMDDPLRLEGFYPCPKPVYATLANDSLIPTPDFVLYQDQAQELDVMTARIDMLNRALKVVGVYDASAEGVQRMLSENVDNKLIAVEQWAVFAEKGGLKGVVDFFPIEMVANVLMNLYSARDKIKQDIYEITGISDIVRGSTNANETATAQQIKGQFATLRLDSMQKDVARFARDAVKIMTEVIGNHFSLDTLKQVSGVRLLTEAEKQQAIASQQPQIDPMTGQPIPPQPLPDIVQKMIKKPTWEEVEAVLRNNGTRCFRVDIETDSTIKADQEAEKASRIEFLTAAGTFIQQAATIPVPELQPLLMEMLKFGVGGFKAGRELDGEFKNALDSIKQKAEQPPPPPQPDMAAQAAQADSQMRMQESQEKLQFDDKKLGVESGFKDRELALKEREIALKEFDTQQRYALETKRLLIDYQNKVNSEVDKPDESMESDGEDSAIMMLAEKMQESIEQKDAALMQIAQMQIAGNNAIVEAITRPKQVVRDGQGKITEVV